LANNLAEEHHREKKKKCVAEVALKNETEMKRHARME
jgi:hypothetical protein